MSHTVCTTNGKSCPDTEGRPRTVFDIDLRGQAPRILNDGAENIAGFNFTVSNNANASAIELVSGGLRIALNANASDALLADAPQVFMAPDDFPHPYYPQGRLELSALFSTNIPGAGGVFPTLQVRLINAAATLGYAGTYDDAGGSERCTVFTEGFTGDQFDGSFLPGASDAIQMVMESWAYPNVSVGNQPEPGAFPENIDFVMSARDELPVQYSGSDGPTQQFGAAMAFAQAGGATTAEVIFQRFRLRVF